jgi:hypothetical protein
MPQDDDFFLTPSTRRISRWVVVGFAILILGVLALPLIAIFTSWL